MSGRTRVAKLEGYKPNETGNEWSVSEETKVIIPPSIGGVDVVRASNAIKEEYSYVRRYLRLRAV